MESLTSAKHRRVLFTFLLYNPRISPLGHIRFFYHFIDEDTDVEGASVCYCCCNHHKHKGLKQYIYCTLQFWAEGPSGFHGSKVNGSSFLRLKGRIHFRVLQFLEVAFISPLVAPSSVFKDNHPRAVTSASIISSPWTPAFPHPLFLRSL